MSESQHIKGACARCHGRIEFPAAATGSTITCPHCGAATPLLPPSPPPEPGMAKCGCRHCHGRIEFPVAAAGMSIACPHCGQQTVLSAGAVTAAAPAGPSAKPPPPSPGAPNAPRPAAALDAMTAALDEIEEAGTRAPPGRRAKPGGKGKALMAVGLVVLLLAGAAGAVFFLKKKPQAEPPKRSGHDLELLSHSLQKAKDGGLVYVVGTLTNHASIQYFNLRVEFDLFDKTGTNKVGHTSDYIGNLGPTSAWSFKALVLEENAAEVKLEKVMGEPDTGGSAKQKAKAGELE